jgi:hypothetical protein
MRHTGSCLCATAPTTTLLAQGSTCRDWQHATSSRELNLMSTGESCTFAKAEQDAAWQAAMQEEIDSIKQNQTWELADLS